MTYLSKNHECVDAMQFRNKPIEEPCIKLICKGVTYYLIGEDEDIFFAWIDKIPTIKHCYGMCDELYLFVQEDELSQEELKNILGMFQRYNIDTKQLKVFLNDGNKAWLGKWVV